MLSRTFRCSEKKIIGTTDVNLKDGDKTPLIVACYKEHLHVVKELLEAGADVNLENKFVSPLQVACYEGHLSVVKELHNAEFNDKCIVFKQRYWLRVIVDI